MKPLRGLGFGVAGSYLANHPQTNSSTGLTPGFTTDGQQKFFSYNPGVNANGVAWRLSPQAYYYYGPFNWLGEYVISAQRVSSITKSADLQNTAWEINGGWVLTGEAASYNGITPAHPFNLHRGEWGALQLVGRYEQLNVDGTAFTDGFASSSKAAHGAGRLVGGLELVLEPRHPGDCEFLAHGIQRIQWEDRAGSDAAQAENVVFTRLQLAF